jgi:hypothetical protein
LEKKFILLLTFVITLLLASFASNVLAAPISATTDKLIYATNETLTVSGKINTTGSASLTLTIYNSSTSVMNSSTTSSSGGSSTINNNTFSFVNTINSSYSPGNYFINLTDGTDTINMSFKVVSQLLTLETHLINALGDIINVSTNTIVTSANQTTFVSGGNLTELVSLSLSHAVHYGNYSIGGKTYHFVLVDETNTSSYDRLYIDDDTRFELFNDTEDSGSGVDIEYQALRKGSLFSNGTFRYIVGAIERTTGNKIILFKPAIGKPPYSTSDTVNFFVTVRNATHLLSNQVISMDIRNSTGNVTLTTTHTTNDFGWFNTSKSLTNVPAGFYVLNLNESLGILPFPVEAFKLFVSTTDQSGNPTSSFAPNSKVRIAITSRNSTSSMNLTSFTATFNYPNGSSISKTKNNFTQVADGIYRYDLDLTSAPTGGYSVSITGNDGTNSQTASTGFEVQSVNFEAMAINTRYMEESSSSGATVNAFPPNSNVTIMTFLSNISAGGISSKGPEGFTGLITPSNCNSSITLTEVKDENGVSYSVNYRAMNLSDALNYFGMSPSESPPEQMLSQCMIIFPTPNKTGIYRAEVKINYQGEEKYSGVIFGVQRLFASGDTVDFKGDDFSYFAPNSTVRIKLKVRDLVTDQELAGNNITSGKIIELEREFPSFRNILANSSERTNLNESIVNGTISFTSPADEGFYMMKFRFTADVAGNTETGMGDAFFMLKKYMIWGQLAGAQQGQWYVKQGQNITITVNVMDIDDAQSVFGGYSSQKTCTGCGGFVINVSEVRNDQQFKTVTGYTVQTGTIINSTNPVANVTIVPSVGTDMQSGWYSVDLIVTDTSTGATYFGWGGFEIRNFWVDVQKAVQINSTHFQMQQQEGPSAASYAVNQTVYFTVLPREPNTPNILDLTNISVESVQWFVGWPPVPLSGYTASVSPKNVTICSGPSMCSTDLRYVVNITNLPTDKQGEYQVNVKVTVNSTSDTGSFRFDISSYQIETRYRMGSWPPLFATTENFTVNFTASDFQNNTHNVTNVTIEDFFNNKQGRPIKMRYGGPGVGNYTTDCSINPEHNLCIVYANISNLLSGEYNVRFAIVDNQSIQKSAEAFFKVQTVVISIPSIEEAWIWETETVNKKVEQNVRKGQWSNCNQYGQNVNRSWIPDASFFCNDYTPSCEGMCQSQQFNLTAPNVSYTKEVYGYIPLMEGSVGRFGSVTNKSSMCMYANGSHMWINATFTGECDLRYTTPIAVAVGGSAVGSNFTDSKGGLWRLDAIGDQTITITGLNTLYKTGVLINTSYSRSGIIKLGQLEERNLGAYTQQGRTGLDLNGDGFTNGTVYFAIADNASAGVYDTFFFSTNGNFTGNASGSVVNPIFVNDADRANREFGFSPDSKQRLTLFTIDPRAQSLKFYSRQIGDRNQLGEVKWNNNITIPIIVASPDGSSQSANVSITGYKNTRTWSLNQTTLVSNENITGVGEIRFNSSDLVGTGDYSFTIETPDEKMEEWKWPVVTVRGFLVDGEQGEALYISNFKPLPLVWKNWEDGIIRIQSDRRNNSAIVEGVISNAHQYNWHDPYNCDLSSVTSVCNDDYSNCEMLKRDDDGQDIFFLLKVNESKIYKNDTSCNFAEATLGTSYVEGSTLILSKQGRNYNMSVLKIDKNDCGSGNCNWRIDFGVAGVNSSIILPMVNRGGQWGMEWGYMQNVSILGSYYDVILANDTSNYQQCVLDSSSECVKKAWIVPSVGNFSSEETKNLTVGENFTADLYLAAIGPNDGDGVTIGNFSDISSFGLSQLPTIGGIPLADNTTGYFVALNETTLGYDLDKNSSTNTTFYMFAFDSDFNNQQNLTSNMVDDDLEMLPWSKNVNGTEIQYDFTQNENYTYSNRTREQWGSLPTGIYTGSVRFGDDYPDVTQWENQPSWDVPFYNNTHMLLKKSEWRVTANQPVDILLKVYNFDQSAISGANISVTQMARSLPWIGFQRLNEGGNYTVDTTYDVTDSYGYSLLKITPATGTWSEGQYQVIANIQTSVGNETWERWFCVGSCNW